MTSDATAGLAGLMQDLSDLNPMAERYEQVRGETERLCEPLEVEDTVIQSMPDVSPSKWHLAHVSWFFEHFILAQQPGYQPMNPDYHYLFNSYYYTVGPMHKRANRGLLSRPTLAEVMDYRRHVDEAMLALLDQASPEDSELAFLLELGLNHEQQHQELFLTDIKHVLSCNPLRPAYLEGQLDPASEVESLHFQSLPTGIQQMGTRHENGFCFDNETPIHEVLLHPASLATRAITNGEYLEFIRDGGYQETALWLSDGWATIQREGWQHPIYWEDDLESEFTLWGQQSLDLSRPVSHLSYYEADAFARWAGARLPLEHEWEAAASNLLVEGNMLNSGVLHPQAAKHGAGFKQMFGDVWEWTASPYTAYPGFEPLAGSVGEYNGKFMCNQLVLRGGSCVTPTGHVRASYRNFFYPASRWQYSGLRLAKDVK